VARVFVDTNVLFPFSVMDLMLALTEDGIHEVLWSAALLDEWERVIVRQQRRSAESAAGIAAVIREYFADSEVPESSFAHLVDEMPSSDPDDRRHIAAAVAGHAEMIVTWNLSDFPVVPLAELGLQVVDPDQYLQKLLGEVPEEVVVAVVRLSHEKRRPPLTPYDLVDMLAKAGVPIFAVQVRDRLDALGEA
jgi:predicted nucleic acid-binding protein